MGAARPPEAGDAEPAPPAAVAFAHAASADRAEPAGRSSSAGAPAAAQRSPAAASRSPGSPVLRLTLHFGLVLLGASAGALWLGGARSGISAALGVVLAGANLLLMRKITSALVDASGGAAAWALALPFKLVALVGVAYALVSSGVARPVPLAMGFALLPLTGVFLPRPSSVPDAKSPAAPITRQPRSISNSLK